MRECERRGDRLVAGHNLTKTQRKYCIYLHASCYGSGKS